MGSMGWWWAGWAWVGCAPLGEVPADGVVSATLEDLRVSEVLLVGGGFVGDAVLTWTTDGGGAGAVPVRISGGGAGLVLAFAGDLNPGRDVALDLTRVEGSLQVDDLLGTYRGPGWNVTVGVGGGRHHLHNRQGVGLKFGDVTAGLALSAQYEWLRIRVADDELPDSGFSLVHTGSPLVGYSYYLPPPAPTVDTGAPAGGGGCGCGSSPSGTDDTTGPTGPTDEDDTGRTGGGEGCSTLPGPAPGLWGAALLVGLRRRRRERAVT